MINLKSECTRAKFIEVGCRIHKRRYHNDMVANIILMLISFAMLIFVDSSFLNEHTCIRLHNG